MRNRRSCRAVAHLERKFVVRVAVLALSADISMASELLQRISEIQREVSGEVARHPAINGEDFSLVWRDSPPRLPACSRPVTKELMFYPSNPDVRPSRVTLKLECTSTPRWTRHVRAQITYLTQADVLSAAVSKGTRFDEALVQKREKRGLPDLSQFQGRLARRDLEIGSELRLNDWEPVAVIRKGGRVLVTLAGTGFQIETEGEALGDAASNDTVQVKLTNGTRVDATAVGENRVVVDKL